MKQKRIKLQALLIVLFIATSLLAIMVGLIQRYIWMNNHMLNSTLEFSKSLTYQLDFSLEYIFTNRINLLQKVAQEVTLAGQTTPQAYRIIKSALQRNSDLTGIGVASSSGTFVLFAHANTAQEKAMIGINISNRDYFSRVMQQKKACNWRMGNSKRT